MKRKIRMKKTIVAFTIITYIIFLSITIIKAASASTKIMPLGDSITQGFIKNIPEDYRVGYRQKLYLDLKDAGYDVDFVGSLSHGILAHPGFDYNHEGHGGWSDNEVAGQVYTWLVANPADIILLHIGTNDFNTSPDDVALILDEIDKYSKDIVVVLALIINHKTYNPLITQFNDNIRAMAEVRIAHCDKIIIVDMENALNYQNDMDDNLHPNTNGYIKMADVWFPAVEQILTDSYQPPPCTPPVPGPALQAYYAFNNGTGTVAIDSSTYKRNGAVNGAVWTAGRSGNGLSFDGVDDYVLIPRMNNDEMSISAWFYKNANDTTNADAIFGGSRWVGVKEGFDVRFHRYSPNTLEFILFTRDRNGVITGKTAKYKFNNSVGNWYHVAGTYKKTTGEQKLYIDGKLVNTQIHPAGNTVMPLAYYSDMRIGYSRSNNGYFNGIIDEVRLYNRALSTIEVENLYKGVTPGLSLTITTVGSGSVSTDPNPPYTSGQTVTLTAKADQGWIFNHWSGDLSGSNNPTTLTITSNKAVTATFVTGTSSDLKALYTLNEGTGIIATDSSGNGKHGAVNGATWTTGKTGGGLSFDGIDDSVSVPRMNYDEISISAWFYKNTNDTTYADAIFGGYKWNSDAQFQQGFDLRFYKSDPDTLQFIVITKDIGGIRSIKTTQKNLTNSVSSWFHAAGTYNKTTGEQKLYINGQLAHIRTHPAGNTIVPLTSYSDMRIGYSRVNNGYFQGIIDDIRIYDRALTDTEVQELYTSY